MKIWCYVELSNVNLLHYIFRWRSLLTELSKSFWFKCSVSIVRCSLQFIRNALCTFVSKIFPRLVMSLRKHSKSSSITQYDLPYTPYPIRHTLHTIPNIHHALYAITITQYPIRHTLLAIIYTPYPIYAILYVSYPIRHTLLSIRHALNAIHYTPYPERHTLYTIPHTPYPIYTMPYTP